MGPRLKLPRYIHAFVDRHGRPRYYFRRPGFEAKRLRGRRTARNSWPTTRPPWPGSRFRSGPSAPAQGL